MMPPAIRRVPPREATDLSPADEGRFLATFLVDQGTSGFVEYKVALPWREGDPTLTELEDEARAALKKRLAEILEEM